MHLDDPLVLRVRAQCEAAALHEAEHRRVRLQHIAVQPLEPPTRGGLLQRLHRPGPQSEALPTLVHDECELGAKAIVLNAKARIGNEAFGPVDLCDDHHRKLVPVVHAAHLAQLGRRDLHGAMKAIASRRG